MKKLAYSMPIFLLVVMGLGAPSLIAKDDLKPIPKEKAGRWGAYSYEEAKAEALKKKKPLAILVIDERSEETTVKEAGHRAFWAFEKNATMVVVMSNLMAAAKSRMSDSLYAALNSAELGKGVPRMVIANTDGTIVLGKMNSEQLIAATDNELKKFAGEMEGANKNPNAVAAAASPSTPNADAIEVKNPVASAWTNTSGQTIQAAVVQISADKVVFQMPNGNRVDYPLANLDAASKKRVEELKAANLK